MDSFEDGCQCCALLMELRSAGSLDHGDGEILLGGSLSRSWALAWSRSGWILSYGLSDFPLHGQESARDWSPLVASMKGQKMRDVSRQEGPNGAVVIRVAAVPSQQNAEDFLYK